MSILFRQPRPEQRVIGTGSAGFAIGYGGGSSMKSALCLAPVYSAVTLITDAISTTPMIAYRKSADGTPGQPLPTQPNLVVRPGAAGVSLSTWLTQCVSSLLLRGNAYGVTIGYEANGYPNRVRWVNPDSVQVDESKGAPIYTINGTRVPDGQMVHIPGFTLPGSIVGLAPTTLFRNTIEMGLNAEQFGHDLLQNGVAPSGKLVNKTTRITPAEADIVKKRFREAVASRDIFVTGNDWDYSALTLSGPDAQFLETMKITASQIAGIFHVNPEDIGGAASSSLTYATLESNQRKMNTRTLLPWSKRIEDCLDDLLPGQQFVRFDLDASVRADLMTRMAGYQTALAAGVFTLAEVRAKENLQPLTEAEVLFWQENFKNFHNGIPGLAENIPGHPGTTAEPVAPVGGKDK